jgi:hypothetical protein
LPSSFRGDAATAGKTAAVFDLVGCTTGDQDFPVFSFDISGDRRLDSSLAMSRIAPQLLIAIGFAAFAAQADAAFMLPEFDRSWEPAESAAAPAEDAAPERSAPVTPQPEIELDDVALLGTGSTSSSGAGSTSAPQLSIDSVVAWTSGFALTAGELCDYRLRESDCLLPVPFLSGIFRPPREA